MGRMRSPAETLEWLVDLGCLWAFEIDGLAGLLIDIFHHQFRCGVRRALHLTHRHRSSKHLATMMIYAIIITQIVTDTASVIKCDLLTTNLLDQTVMVIDAALAHLGSFILLIILNADINLHCFAPAELWEAT